MRELNVLLVLFYVFANFACVWSGRSPHADLVEKYYKTGPEAGRYSNNVLEDALLDIPDLIRKYNYPVEVHEVTTEDGYILQVMRVPHGRDNNNVPLANKPVVFIMHGLLGSCADFVIMGPGTALVYSLAEAGYDVWLGNARGTYYSRRHVSLNPDDTDERYWRFSWEEIGNTDVPTMIDYVLDTTGKSRLHYIGHSQGTVAFWVMASLRPEYNDKIITMHAYAPVAYLEYNDNPFFKVAAPYATNLEILANEIGFNEFVPKSPLIAWVGRQLCSDGAITQPICTNLLLLVAGDSRDMHNATMFPVKLAHAPAGASVRQIIHFAQHIGHDFFRRFNHGILENWNRYGSFVPPLYDLSKITAKIYLHYAEVDVFADLRDLERLAVQLKNATKLRVPLDDFSHLDFCWGSGAHSLLYEPTIEILDSYSAD